jgi:hypothetical protein
MVTSTVIKGRGSNHRPTQIRGIETLKLHLRIATSNMIGELIALFVVSNRPDVIGGPEARLSGNKICMR